MYKRVCLTLLLLMTVWHPVTAVSFNPDWGTVGVFTEAQTCAGSHRASNTPAVMRFADAQGRISTDNARLAPACLAIRKDAET